MVRDMTHDDIDDERGHELEHDALGLPVTIVRPADELEADA
jgi:hypothetical protein